MNMHSPQTSMPARGARRQGRAHRRFHQRHWPWHRNAICPGYVCTPLAEAQIEGQAKARSIPRDQVIRDVLLARQPNKRFATVDEMGAIAVFLASEAAAPITGVALPADGGWTAH